MSKRIPLTRGKFATVDDEDYSYLKKWKWFAVRTAENHTFHAVRRVIEYGKDITILMHREIMGADNGLLAGKKLDMHHKDCEGLNNRKDNLQYLTRSKHISLHKRKHGCKPIE